MESVRVMVFYDGNFFKQGQIYFRYKEKRGWFSLSNLHLILERYVAAKSKSSSDVTKVVAAHYYDGRTTTMVAEPEHLEKERDFEMALIQAGIIPHYLPVKESPKTVSASDEIRFALTQKGVDVLLAIDVLDFANENRFDVAVLISGDEDFVPLVRRVTSLGKHVLLAYFDIDTWTDDRNINHRPTRASRALIDAASFSLNFNHFVRDKDWKTEIATLFFKPTENVTTIELKAK